MKSSENIQIALKPFPTQLKITLLTESNESSFHTLTELEFITIAHSEFYVILHNHYFREYQLVLESI